jgi:hypothetical protein
LGLFCIKRAEYVDVSSFRARELWPTPNWLCLALFSGFRFPPASLATGHWPLATGHSPYQKNPTPRRLSVGATRGPLRTLNCQREGAASRHLCIVQSRRAVPKILGTQVFPDAASVSAIDSSCWNRAPALPVITASCPGLPCACSSPRSNVTSFGIPPLPHCIKDRVPGQ